MSHNATVGQWMSAPVVTVTSAWGVRAAYDLMREMGIRHLPVVDDKKLVGLVTITDIQRASPSDATSLSVWELNYLWNKITVGEIMTRDLYTAKEDDPLKDAVRVMLDKKFGCLPVVGRNGELIGILTESDIFRFVVDGDEGEREPVGNEWERHDERIRHNDG